MPSIGRIVSLSMWPLRRLSLLALVVGFVGLAGMGSATTLTTRLASASPFVSGSNGQLMLNGAPWKFTGYDDYMLPSLAVGAGYNCGGIYSTTWLDQTLDEMKSASGTTVVRTWFFQSFNMDNYVQLDTVLAAAAARNIKVIPVLVNQWGDCENGWGPQGQRPYRTLTWYQGGYRQTNDGYSLSFRNYAIATAQRYANNPTIAFWQLVNEAEALDSNGGICEQTAAAQAIRSFADDVTGAIKAVDPNHLVSLGTLGGGQCGIAGPNYAYVHAGAIDICEYHDYGTAAISADPWNGNAVDIRACRGMNKPIFAGEVGIDTASVGAAPTTAVLQGRAQLFQAKLNAQFGSGTSGFLIWTKSSGPSGGLGVGPGDPLEGVLAAFQSQLDRAAGSGGPTPLLPGGPSVGTTVLGPPHQTSVSAGIRAAARPGSQPALVPIAAATPSPIATSLLVLKAPGSLSASRSRSAPAEPPSARAVPSAISDLPAGQGLMGMAHPGLLPPGFALVLLAGIVVCCGRRRAAWSRRLRLPLAAPCQPADSDL